MGIHHPMQHHRGWSDDVIAWRHLDTFRPMLALTALIALLWCAVPFDFARAAAVRTPVAQPVAEGVTIGSGLAGGHGHLDAACGDTAVLPATTKLYPRLDAAAANVRAPAPFPNWHRPLEERAPAEFPPKLAVRSLFHLAALFRI